MIFQRINPQIYHIFKKRQISRMRMPLQHHRNVVSVKQIKQIVSLLKVKITRMPLRSVFFKEMSVSKHYDMPISLILFVFQHIFKPITLVTTKCSVARIDSDIQVFQSANCLNLKPMG